MRRAVICLALLALPACGGRHAQPGNVDLLWNFADGNTCATLGGRVSHMQVSMPGQALQNGGAFPCQAAGTQGIELQSFAAGNYNYTVQAIDPGGNVLYAGSGGFNVNGNVTATATLQPSGLPGNVDLLWSFSDGNSCASLQGLISFIQVTIPGEALANGGQYPCQAAGTQGVELQNFAPGSYGFTVQAIDSAGREAYRADGSFSVNGSVQISALLTPG